jgi:hypothetical protein
MLRRLRRLLPDTDAAPLVVRAHSPLLRNVLLAGGSLIALFALYVFYELGRYDAGYDRLAVAQQRTELEVRIEHLEKDNRELRTKLAELDTIRLGQPNEQAEMARTLGELQGQVERQSKELAFYRGLVAQGANSLGIRIEQLHILPGSKPDSFVLHMALVRASRPDAEALGSLQLTLEGSANGIPRTLDLATMSAGRTRELRYAFRYLQNFEQELTLPPGFKPERLAVEVQSSRHEVAPLSQTFLWTVETAP